MDCIVREGYGTVEFHVPVQTNLKLLYASLTIFSSNYAPCDNIRILLNECKDEFCDPQINLREGSQQFHQLREGSQQFRQAADILPRQHNAAQPSEIVVSNAFVDVHTQGMMYLPNDVFAQVKAGYPRKQCFQILWCCQVHKK
eukprot:scaffold2736_cov264-Chaetoceros_neogracile.AAC.10